MKRREGIQTVKSRPVIEIIHSFIQAAFFSSSMSSTAQLNGRKKAVLFIYETPLFIPVHSCHDQVNSTSVRDTVTVLV